MMTRAAQQFCRWMIYVVATLAVVLTAPPQSARTAEKLDLLKQLKQLAPEIHDAMSPRTNLCPAADRIPVDAAAQNSTLAVHASAYCLRAVIAHRRPSDGKQFLMVEGRLSNRSTKDAMDVPVLADLFVLQFGAGRTVMPHRELAKAFSPGFSQRPLQPLDDRTFIAVFEVPAGEIVRPRLIIPSAQGIINLALAPAGKMPQPLTELSLEGPDLSATLLALEPSATFEGKPAPAGSHYVSATVRLDNQRGQRLDTDIARYVALPGRSGKRYTPEPPPSDAADSFSDHQTVFPGIPVIGKLAFLVPDNDEIALGKVSSRAGAYQKDTNIPANGEAVTKGLSPSRTPQAPLQQFDTLTVDRALSLNPKGEEVNVAAQTQLSWQINGAPELTDGRIDSTGRGEGYPYWRKGGTFTVGFSRAYAIEQLRIGLRSPEGAVGYRYKIEGSLDGKTWQLLVDGSTRDHRGVESFAIGPVRIRMLRVTSLSGPDGYLFVSELEAYTREPVPDVNS